MFKSKTHALVIDKDKGRILAHKTIVDTLTEEQQDWYLSETHIKGKTPWSAYEKANAVYLRYKTGVGIDNIKKRFNIKSDVEIRKRINTIQMMKDNNDLTLENFSYYDVIERVSNIKESIQDNPKLKDLLFNKIKEKPSEFTAMHLRDKLPTILKSKKHKRKFIQNGDLDSAYEAAKTNNPDSKLRLAVEKMQDIEKKEVSNLDSANRNRLKLTLKKLKRQYERVEGIIKECEQ